MRHYRKTILASAFALAMTSTAYAEMLFTVPYGVSQGHMNMRTGPGSNHDLIGAIPQGQRVSASRCVPRDDGVAGADWCLVDYAGTRGWVSRAGLMPYNPEPRGEYLPAPPPADAYAQVAPVPPPVLRSVPPQTVITQTRNFVCRPTQDGRDRNPPVALHIGLDVDSSGNAEHMRVVYDLWNGQRADRAKQYDNATMETSKDRTIYSWNGIWSRDANVTMTGALYYGQDGRWFYREKQWKKGFVENDNTFPCQPEA
jgi:uncharacterized protein YgiM (DUF1202 family)